jgi:hypothetical protein
MLPTLSGWPDEIIAVPQRLGEAIAPSISWK